MTIPEQAVEAAVREWVSRPSEVDANRMYHALEAALPSLVGVQRMEWQPIKTAPTDGRLALVYRPLAHTSGDQPVTVKRLIGGNHHCWDSTVPTGQKPTNPTSGACHVTHWMPIPDPPLVAEKREKS